MLFDTYRGRGASIICPVPEIPSRIFFVSCPAILSRYFFYPSPLRFSVGPLSFSPFLHPHPPHRALLQLRIIPVLGWGITEHVCPAGAAVQVTEEIGFEIEHFQVDIHLINHALLLVCRLLHPYAISKNRQAAISLLEVGLKPIAQ